MRVKKFETNFRRKMFLNETNEILFSPDIFKEENSIINIYPSLEFNEFLGFGGALTGSSCYNLSICNEQISNQILNEYFLESNMNYNICRLSISSSDFSLNSYSYSNKTNLSDFSISEDMKYVVPIIKMAQKRNKSLKFLASPWSPPAFMKNNKSLLNGGTLLPDFKKLYAIYLVKFIEAYKKENINIDYMTIQNEPNAVQTWESCIYSPIQEMDLLSNYIYPEFKKHNINTKLLIWDHNKDKILDRVLNSFKFDGSFEKVSGIAFHWYTGDHFENIELLRKMFPNKLLIHTEGCTRLLCF